ncbi:hypothetical protein ACFZAO_05565 [Streptomyces griseoaurantiacus]|uniref:hypothetical protein n=1 Tax=Streptomyces griseoaurantiacus TaxID=68213 RepID=UPI0036EFDB35
MTRPTPPQSLAEHRRELTGRPRPPAAGRQAEEAAADRALARRIHAAQPGIGLEAAYTVLQALRALHEIAPDGITSAAVVDRLVAAHQATIGELRATEARLRLLEADRSELAGSTAGDEARADRAYWDTLYAGEGE